MNLFGVLWFVILICSLDFTLAQSNSNSESSELFIGKYPIPSKTPAPLNIDTNKVKNVTLPLLRFTAIMGANTKILNNGHAIEVINEQTTPQTTVTGGPLQDIYIYHGTRYYWSSNSNESAGGLINGAHGVPIRPVSVWYNQKYGSFNNSLNYRDGLAEISFPVKIGPLPSLTFIPFLKKLKKVRKSGSFVITNVAETFIWFDNYLLPNTPYFAYPGAYYDQITSKVYYCGTVIAFIPETNYISQEQFEDSFLGLKNSKGERLINFSSSYPQDDIPVVRAEGQIQVFVPVGKELLDVSKA